MTKCAPPSVSTGVTEWPCLAQQADQLGGLVGGDAAADDEEDAAHALAIWRAADRLRKVGEGFGQEGQADK